MIRLANKLRGIKMAKYLGHRLPVDQFNNSIELLKQLEELKDSFIANPSDISLGYMISDIYREMGKEAQGKAWEIHTTLGKTPEWEDKLTKKKLSNELRQLLQSGVEPPAIIKDHKCGDVSIRMSLIPPSKFIMGDLQADVNANNPPINVELTDAYWMATTPVTQKTFSQVMGYNPSHFREVDRAEDCPVENVTWFDAVAFCNKLTELEGITTPYYQISNIVKERDNIVSAEVKIVGKEDDPSYRLPSEAKWENGCKAWMDSTPFWWGDTATSYQANFDGNYPYGTNEKGPYRQHTTPVDMFKPNPFGLYDMHGNVWEWIGDYYDHNFYTRVKAEAEAKALAEAEE